MMVVAKQGREWSVNWCWCLKRTHLSLCIGGGGWVMDGAWWWGFTLPFFFLVPSGLPSLKKSSCHLQADDKVGGSSTSQAVP